MLKIFGALCVFIVIFGFGYLSIEWTRMSLEYWLQLVTNKSYYVPFWPAVFFMVGFNIMTGYKNFGIFGFMIVTYCVYCVVGELHVIT